MDASNVTQGSAEDVGVGAFDTLTSIYQYSREMAAMAEMHGYTKLAGALELSRALAAEALAQWALSRHSGLGNAAPEEAA
jgi:hypothetical protein